ncbi:MAG: hypothetical protein NTX45_02130 [Proteobacteria bacterium]|nr:hypothetical protein [Pseudomonadota bacterium]
MAKSYSPCFAGMARSYGSTAWRLGRAGLGVLDKTMTEIVKRIFQHAGSDIGGFGILVVQQRGGVGFAAGGKMRVFQEGEVFIDDG